MNTGFALLEIVRDTTGKAVDVRTLELKGKREQDGAGLDPPLGQMWSELGIEPEWLERVIKVGENAVTVRHEERFAPPGRCIETRLFKIEADRVGAVFLDVTERKEADEAVIESEQLYRTLFESTEDGFGLLEPVFDDSGSSNDYRILRVNEAWERSTGLRADEVVGRTIREALPDVEGVRPDIYAEVARTGAAKRFESYNPRSGRWYELYAFRYREGKVGVVFRDITERKMADAKLEQSESILQSFFQSPGVIRGIVDVIDWREIRYVKANADAARFAGFPSGAIDGKLASDLGIMPKVVKGDLERYAECFNSGNPITFTAYDSRGSGRWLSCTISHLGTTEGGDQRFSFIATDVTEQKRAEEALRESEERSRSVLDNSQDAIYRFNIQTGRYEYVSPSFERVIGYSAEEMLSMSIEQAMAIIHPDDIQEVNQILARLEDQGENQYDYRLLDKSGEYRWISNHLTLILDGSGRPMYRDGVIRNITESKRTEEVLKESEIELRRSNEDLQQFAYVASHDLQEPLRMVTTYIDLLERKFGNDLSPQAKEFMHFAVDGSMRMKKLIDDLLQYSRIESRPTELVDVDMSEVAMAVINELHIAIDEGGAEIVVGSLPTIRADEMQMKMLLTNLISNAIKFHGREKPMIEVSVCEKEDELVFSVSDNGIGIDPRYQDKLFKMFSRLHTRDEYPGTGIGLAIAKKIVEHHGGRIWFESKPGKWTAFYFTLPRL